VTLSFGTAACGLGSSSHHSAAPTTTKPPHKPPAVAASPDATVQDYIGNWDNKDWSAMAQDVQAAPADFAKQNAAVYADLDATSLHLTSGPVATTGATASAEIFQAVGLGRYHGQIVLHSTMHLERVGGRWLVRWSPELLDRQMTAGDRFEVSTTFATRAGVTGQDGQSLVTDASQVEVGVVGQRIKHPNTVRSLLIAGGATAAAASAAIKAAKAHPTYFEPVFEISQAEFKDHVKGSALYNVPGTQFESTPAFGAVTANLGTYLLGDLGPITAQQLHQLKSPYEEGDTVGQGGLEGEYQTQLAGTPGAQIVLVNRKGAQVGVIGQVAAKAGKPVKTSISIPIQKDAESAISGTSVPAAAVVVQASTGKVLALATHDPSASSDGYVNYALDAAEAPGSTFKTITSTALIEDKGLTTTTPATCPVTRTVDGETFHNDDGEASAGNIDLLTAFAESCNTAFIGLATSNLTAEQLVAAAKSYDIGTTPQMGYPAYGGDVPKPTDEADLASTAIGQGQITVSPLDLAMVAAAIDSGTVRSPQLVVGAPDDKAATHPVNGTVDADLKTMMAAVVASGTAAGQGLPSGTYAKTGTAEYGTANPPLTHAWLIGFRGDVAFAVFVNTGVSGGVVAAPLAAKLLDAIGSADGA
jgi:cell division protein FtsI/penicillin-binding protein 2